MGKARHRDPMFPASERLRPRRPVRMGFQAAVTAAGLKGEYNHNLPAAHTPGPADYMRGRIDHIQIPARAEYIPALAEDILVLAEDNPVPAEDILVRTVHKRATAANSPALLSISV